MSFLSVVAFLPLFMQLGQGLKATTSGLSTLPLMIGLILAATLCGRLVTKTGRYKPILLVGVTTVLAGTFLLSLMDYHTSRLDLGWRMAILGVGLGPLQGTYGIAVQNSVPIDRIGVVTSAHQFFRQIGSTVGVAIFGTLLTEGLNAKLQAWSESTGQAPLDLSGLRSLAVDAQVNASAINVPEPIRKIIAESVTHVFLLSLIGVVLALIATVMVPELPMRERLSAARTKDAVPAETHL
jgi:MFS family permease